MTCRNLSRRSNELNLRHSDLWRRWQRTRLEEFDEGIIFILPHQ